MFCLMIDEELFNMIRVPSNPGAFCDFTFSEVVDSLALIGNNFPVPYILASCAVLSVLLRAWHKLVNWHWQIVMDI